MLTDALSQPTDALPSVGPKIRGHLASGLSIGSVGELLLHLPHRVIDRRRIVTVAEIQAAAAGAAAAAAEQQQWGDHGAGGEVDRDAGVVASMLLTVVRHTPGVGRQPSTITCVDGNGEEVELTYFLGGAAYASRQWEDLTKNRLPLGAPIVASGTVKRKPKRFGGAPVQMLPVDVAEPLEGVGAGGGGGGAGEGALLPSLSSPSSVLDRVLVVEPSYRLSAGLTLKKVRDLLGKARGLLPPQGLPHPHPHISSAYRA